MSLANEYAHNFFMDESSILHAHLRLCFAHITMKYPVLVKICALALFDFRLTAHPAEAFARRAYSYQLQTKMDSSASTIALFRGQIIWKIANAYCLFVYFVNYN